MWEFSLVVGMAAKLDILMAEKSAVSSDAWLVGLLVAALVVMLVALSAA
jgi:hypothetical protein